MPFTNQQIKQTLFSATVLLAGASYPIASVADTHSASRSLSYTQRALSNHANPAAAAMVIERKDPHLMSGGMLELGLGLEYGDFDNLFDWLNEISDDFEPSDPDDPGNGPGDGPGDDGGINWDKIFEEYPELEEQLDAIKDIAAERAAIYALILAEGYGKAEVSFDAPFVINEDLWGGTLMMGFNAKANSKALGIFQDINFDEEQARRALTIQNPDFIEGYRRVDISGGLIVYIDLDNRRMKVDIDNDSLLLVKGTKIMEFSMSYSRAAFENDYGKLYWGVKPSIYWVGLTNVGARFGDIEDAKSLFEDIKDADYDYQTGADVDLGLVWASDHYQVGFSTNNLFEHTYRFPEVSRSRFLSEQIVKQLESHETYLMERQYKLEAGIYTDQRHWSLHIEGDLNSITDPMKDKYKWVTVTGGYASDSYWLPSARVGYSKNLAGSELSYLNAGVTFAKIFNLDVSAALDKVKVDEDTFLRGVNVNFGVQFAY